MTALTPQALIGFIDLTDLSDQCSESTITTLCATAISSPVQPASLCLWPQFVSLAQRTLGQSLPVATVINFPHGGDDIEFVLTDLDEAISDGADEIDLVFPWRAFLAGDTALAFDMIAAAKERCGLRLLKIILETGALPHAEAIRAASLCALDAGADFLKTSTGKIEVGATEAAAQIMLETIRDHGNTAGFKASGGLRTFAQAERYYTLFETICGMPATKERFRIGASALFETLIKETGRPS